MDGHSYSLIFSLTASVESSKQSNNEGIQAIDICSKISLTSKYYSYLTVKFEFLSHTNTIKVFLPQINNAIRIKTIYYLPCIITAFFC